MFNKITEQKKNYIDTYSLHENLCILCWKEMRNFIVNFNSEKLCGTSFIPKLTPFCHQTLNFISKSYDYILLVCS